MKKKIVALLTAALLVFGAQSVSAADIGGNSFATAQEITNNTFYQFGIDYSGDHDYFVIPAYQNIRTKVSLYSPAWDDYAFDIYYELTNGTRFYLNTINHAGTGGVDIVDFTLYQGEKLYVVVRGSTSSDYDPVNTYTLDVTSTNF